MIASGHITRIVAAVMAIAVCLCFCETHLIITLIGVCLSYLLINGLLEQLFLYSSFQAEK